MLISGGIEQNTTPSWSDVYGRGLDIFNSTVESLTDAYHDTKDVVKDAVNRVKELPDKFVSTGQPMADNIGAYTVAQKQQADKNNRLLIIILAVIVGLVIIFKGKK